MPKKKEIEEEKIINLEEIDKEPSLNDLPVKTPTILKNLKQNGYTELNDIAEAKPAELTRITDLSKAEAEKNIEYAENNYVLKTVLDYKGKPGEEVLRTGLEDVDEGLGGGIRNKEITTIAGNPGTGKTLLCHALIGNYKKKHPKGKTAYVDARQNFNEEILKNVCKEKKLKFANVADSVYRLEYLTTDKLEVILKQLDNSMRKDPDLKLIIIDSLTRHFLLEATNPREYSKLVKLRRVLMKLRDMAIEHKAFIIVTTQISSAWNKEIPVGYTPYGGQDLLSRSDQFIYFHSFRKNDKRTISIVPAVVNDKSSSLAIINKNGLLEGSSIVGGKDGK